MLAFLGVVPAKLWEFPEQLLLRLWSLAVCSLGEVQPFTEINSVGGSALNSNSGSFGPYLP